MHIYSIPECLTDEETFEDEDCHWKSESFKKIQKSKNLKNSSKKHPTLRIVSSSCSEINLVSNGCTEKLHYPKINIKSQVSTSLINMREIHHNSDSGTSEKDNSDLFTHAAPFNKNTEEMIPNPYQEKEDYNSNRDSLYEALLIPNPSLASSLTSPQGHRIINLSKSDTSIFDGNSHYETLLATQPSQLSNAFQSKETTSKTERESPTHISPKSNPKIEIGLDSQKRHSTRVAEVHDLQQHSSRNRSGSVQWIQNIIQNIDHKCRSFLDLRRPSDIAEVGIRNSNEELEMAELSDEESSKNGVQSTSSAGRRFSENVIGKQQKRFPALSSGFGHLRDLWKDRGHESKKQDLKDIDQLRPDVCPLFSFPDKTVDEDEMILDAVRLYYVYTILYLIGKHFFRNYST